MTTTITTNKPFHIDKKRVYGKRLFSRTLL
jgi:hypothetical protein